MMSRIAASLLFLGAALLPARAHDLWLVPDDNVIPGKPITVRAHVGMDFPRSEHAPDPALFKRRIVVGPDGKEGELKAAGKKGKSGLVQFEAKQAGIYILAIETQPKLITLDAAAFNNYLVADGLAHIYRLRHKEKTLDQPGRERYSKYCKALVHIGNGDGGPCRSLGMLLEIVPLRDPFALKAGDALPVRVMFQGKPLREANVGWQLPGDGASARGYLRSDDRGQALVPIARTGLMTIRLTHMTRPKAKNYEWESFWTTLTFRIP